jgi:peptidoglycan/LPS O-acetylase OafA/YrhL
MEPVQVFVPPIYDVVWSLVVLGLVIAVGWWLIRVLERWRRRSLHRSAVARERTTRTAGYNQPRS